MKKKLSEKQQNALTCLYRAIETCCVDITEKGVMDSFFTEKEKEKIFDLIFETEQKIAEIIMGLKK